MPIGTPEREATAPVQARVTPTESAGESVAAAPNASLAKRGRGSKPSLATASAQRDGSIKGGTLIQMIIDRLPQQAVLLFGIALLMFLTTITGLSIAAFTNNPLPLYFGYGSLLACLLAAIWATNVTRKEAMALPLPAPEKPPVSPSDPVEFEEFSSPIMTIRRNIEDALRQRNPVFRNSINENLNQLVILSQEWSRHRITVRGSAYNTVLLKLYTDARQKVFSTCLPDYLETWDSPLGRRLVEAHSASPATVLRVFVFDRRSDITRKAVDIMEKVADSVPDGKMRVYVWIDEEDVSFDFPTILSKDFTNVDDGKAIGITLVLRGVEQAAEWHFDDDPLLQTCTRVEEGLIRGGKPLKKFLETWRPEEP